MSFVISPKKQNRVFREKTQGFIFLQNSPALPVIDFDVLVSLRVVHEPHQLQVEDRREGEELDSFFCFLRNKGEKKGTTYVYRSILYMIMDHSQIFFIKAVFHSSNNEQSCSRSVDFFFFFLFLQQMRFRQPCPRAQRMSTVKSAHLLRSRFEQRRGDPRAITERRTCRVQRPRQGSGGGLFRPGCSAVTHTWRPRRTSDFRGCGD